jgi:signal transduction histidine kinase
MINNILNKYLDVDFQIIEFEKDGLVKKVKNTLLDIQIGSEIFDFHPFFETLRGLIEENCREEFFQAVNIEKENLIVDVVFSIGNEDQLPFVLLIDKTAHYSNIQSLTQLKNEVSIENYKVSLKNFNLINKIDIQSEFLVSISHDLKTPIHSIVNLLSLLDKNNLTYEQRELCKTIFESSKYLNRLITDVYELASIETGLFNLKEKEFSLQDLISRIEKIYQRKLVSKNVELRIIKAAKLPDLIIGDSDRLLQILFNLLDNASEYTNEGFVELEIQQVYKKSLNVGLNFIVRDSGKGFEVDKEDVSIKNAQLKFDSNDEVGLGISIVTNLVNNLNGNVKFESIIDKGTNVEVYLPFKLVKGVSKNSIVSKIKKKKLKRIYNVLIVDDNEINKLIVMKLLINHGGFYIDVALDGDQAIDMLANEKYDFILLDLHLSKVSSFDVIKRIKSHSNDLVNAINFIPMTTGINSEDTLALQKYNLNAVLKKPFLSEELYQSMYDYM